MVYFLFYKWFPSERPISWNKETSQENKILLKSITDGTKLVGCFLLEWISFRIYIISIDGQLIVLFLWFTKSIKYICSRLGEILGCCWWIPRGVEVIMLLTTLQITQSNKSQTLPAQLSSATNILVYCSASQHLFI